MYGEADDEIEKLRETVRMHADAFSDYDADMQFNVSKPVAAERAAILKLIEAERATLRIYDGDYALQTVAAAIRTRG
jgi:hypothetical protein